MTLIFEFVYCTVQGSAVLPHIKYCHHVDYPGTSQSDGRHTAIVSPSEFEFEFIRQFMLSVNNG